MPALQASFCLSCRLSHHLILKNILLPDLFLLISACICAWKSRIVFLPCEALFLGRSQDFAVPQETGSAVVIESRYSQDVHSWYLSLEGSQRSIRINSLESLFFNGNCSDLCFGVGLGKHSFFGFDFRFLWLDSFLEFLSRKEQDKFVRHRIQNNNTVDNNKRYYILPHPVGFTNRNTLTRGERRNW